jgi:hypothetical protein
MRPGLLPGEQAEAKPANRRRLSVLVVQAGQPDSQPIDGGFEFWVFVDELPEPKSQPGQGNFLVAAAGSKLFDSPVCEIHRLAAPESGGHDRPLFHFVAQVGTYRRRTARRPADYLQRPFQQRRQVQP